MTTADIRERPHDAPGVDTAAVGLDGRMLLAVGTPFAGKDRFVEQALHRATAESRDTLHVAATRGHDRLAGSFPARTRVVDCSPGPDTESDRVTDVGNPADLTGIGMAISQFLETAGPRPVVTVDSVSTLLAYNDDAAVFRFLAVLSAQLRKVDGVGIFLVEEGCHDRQTVKTFQQLFDGRVDVEPDRARIRGVDGQPPGWAPR